jgi:hypothetical protein
VNALSTRLWARTVQLVNRAVARMLGIPQRDWLDHGRISVAKVAEYQARGVVHFHAIFRLDGPDGDEDQLPAGATVDLLARAVTQAVGTARLPAPTDGQCVQWGDQLDLRPISTGEAAPAEPVSCDQVAAYLAKYATKGTEASGAVDHPFVCRECQGTGRVRAAGSAVTRTCQKCAGTGIVEPIDDLRVRPHAKTLISTCWRLGGTPELAKLRLRPWAHMLGFRGHFATKSRRYSTTLGCLRDPRRIWRETRTLLAYGLDPTTPIHHRTARDPDTLDEHATAADLEQDAVVVIGSWRYTGCGHSPGEAVFAATIAADLAESRRLWRLTGHDEDPWEVAA